MLRSSYFWLLSLFCVSRDTLCFLAPAYKSPALLKSRSTQSPNLYGPLANDAKRSIKLYSSVNDKTAPDDAIEVISRILSKPGLSPTLAKMFLISAPLGMLLDNQHGLFGVLEYESIGLPIKLTIGSTAILKTAAWVPALFGFAGFVMSAIVLVLDEILQTKPAIRSPSWPKTLYGISLFSAQYYLSGLLDYTSVDNIAIHGILAALAAVGFAVFDGSLAGFLLGIATAVSGPLAEIFLINLPHLYQYTHADFAGICSWIPWVYFLGAPAVGNLARRLYDDSGNTRRGKATAE